MAESDQVWSWWIWILSLDESNNEYKGIKLIGIQFLISVLASATQ